MVTGLRSVPSGRWVAIRSSSTFAILSAEPVGQDGGGPMRPLDAYALEKSYPNVTYFHEADRGGHFAAWEEPELFATEIRRRSSRCQRQPAPVSRRHLVCHHVNGKVQSSSRPSSLGVWQAANCADKGG